MHLSHHSHGPRSIKAPVAAPQMEMWPQLVEEMRESNALGAARLAHEHGLATRAAEVLVVGARGSGMGAG